MPLRILSSLPQGSVGRRGGVLFGFILAANLAAWAFAASAFGGHPTLLALALLAYSLGLRHGADADHIAAIDNVTRRLMGEGRRPIATGLFFSLGHGSVVLIATALIALAAGQAELPLVKAFGEVIGPMVSGLFLFAIAAANLIALARLWRQGPGAPESPPGGLIARILGPAMRLVKKSWHMLPLGFLFGLGFDTASEISLMALSAGQAAHGLPFASVMLLPILFVVGMALVDVSDNLLMLGVYGWAMADPARRRRYDMAVTGLSAGMALVIGAMQLIGIAGERLDLAGGAFAVAEAINERSSEIGYTVIGLFAVVWVGLLVAGRRKVRATS